LEELEEEIFLPNYNKMQVVSSSPSPQTDKKLKNKKLNINCNK